MKKHFPQRRLSVHWSTPRHSEDLLLSYAMGGSHGWSLVLFKMEDCSIYLLSSSWGQSKTSSLIRRLHSWFVIAARDLGSAIVRKIGDCYWGEGRCLCPLTLHLAGCWVDTDMFLYPPNGWFDLETVVFKFNNNKKERSVQLKSWKLNVRNKTQPLHLEHHWRSNCWTWHRSQG